MAAKSVITHAASVDLLYLLIDKIFDTSLN